MENRTHDRQGQFWYVAVYDPPDLANASSGRVKIAKHSITGKYAAIKIVPKGLILNSRMSMSEAGARADKVLLGIEREIVIMKLIDHPNVLNLYDVWETSGEL
jgi:serine/threonine-protein kinase HSL1 (negative regulator of Swe1 kinase)